MSKKNKSAWFNSTFMYKRTIWKLSRVDINKSTLESFIFWHIGSYCSSMCLVLSCSVVSIWQGNILTLKCTHHIEFGSLSWFDYKNEMRSVKCHSCNLHGMHAITNCSYCYCRSSFFLLDQQLNQRSIQSGYNNRWMSRGVSWCLAFCF